MEALGVLLALATVVLIGAYVFGVAYYAEDFGWLAPIFLARAFATLFLAATAVAAKQWRFPERSSRLLGVIVLLALVDTGGYVFFNFGSRHAETSIVAAAASPYSVVPILMGVFLLAERPARVQWVGIAFVVSGLVLLALFSG
jgi:drug/metabolite transporter (DMT)-like permease